MIAEIGGIISLNIVRLEVRPKAAKYFLIYAVAQYNRKPQPFNKL